LKENSRELYARGIAQSRKKLLKYVPPW